MHDCYDVTFYPYYGKLNALQKAIYKELFIVVRDAITDYVPKFSATSEDVFKAVKAIHYDRPEFVWMDGGSNTTTRNGVVIKVSISYNELAKKHEVYRDELNKAAKKYLDGLKLKQKHEAERIVHDLMARNITYVHSSLDQTAYAALVKGKAVCAGYSRGFQLLMTLLDIPCYYCFGSAKNSKSTSFEAHSWNILKLGSDFYVMDLTWDDCYNSSKTDKIGYTYYNCTDAEIALNHKRDNECLFLPKCLGKNYRFEAVNGVKAELELIYQDGVTHKEPINLESDLVKLIRQYVRTKDKKKVTFSFPTCQKKICDNLSNFFRNVMSEPESYKGSWQFNSSTTDYKNGWYKVEVTAILK